MELHPTTALALLSSGVGSGNAPWWGVSVLAGVFTLLGAGISQLTTWLLDRSRARRADATRWHRDRLEAYSVIMQKLDRIFSQLVDDEARTADPMSIYDAVEAAASHATLVAGRTVGEAISSTINLLASAADSGWTMDGVNEIDASLKRLRQLMRDELGISYAASK
jgi:hypothetical protein